MIIREDTLDIKILYNIEQHFKGKKICFFDIETTGLSRVKNNIYLIGLIYHDNSSYRAIQWLDDTGKCEKEMIESFINESEKYDVLINYNGNSFDVPFIEEKAEKYDLNFSSDNFISFDIYKAIHKYKYFFGLNNLKQKSIELFLKIMRTDEYDGGRLIEIYYQYLKNHSEDLLHLLLLHNYDDICGLVEICDIFSYVNIAEGNFIAKHSQLDNNNLIIECELLYKLKIPFSIRTGDFYISAGSNSMKVLIPIINTSLKYFYKDYKNYFYLPAEDMAIHKSVAQFVDKEHKIKATKATSYINKEGLFIKEFSEIITPTFKEAYDSKEIFFEATAINETDKSKLQEYLIDVIKHISTKSKNH